MQPNATPENYQSLLHDASNAVTRRWRLIAAVSLTMVLTVYLALLFVSSKYEAGAKLMVKLGRENTEVPLTVNRGMVNTIGVQKEEINTYISLLTSRRLAEAAVDRVGLERFLHEPPPPKGFFKAVKYYLKRAWREANKAAEALLDGLGLKPRLSDREGAIKTLSKNLTAIQEKDSNVILVTVRLSDPALALDTLNAALEFFFKRHHELFHSTDLRTMFDEQTKAMLKELDGVQQDIDKVKAKWGVKSVGEQRSRLIERLYKVRHELDEEAAQFKTGQHLQTLLAQALKTHAPSNLESEVVQPNPRADQMRQRRTELQMERAHKSELFEPGTEVIKALEEEIASINALLAKEEAQQRGAKTFKRDPLYDKLYHEAEWGKVSLANLEVAMAEKRRQVEALEGELKRLDRGAYELHVAELAFNSMEQRIISYTARQEEARIDDVLDRQRIANVAVLSEPAVGEEAVSPPRMLIMGVGLGSSLLLGFLAALLLEWREERVFEEDDLARLGDLPFLGTFHLPGGKPGP